MKLTDENCKPVMTGESSLSDQAVKELAIQIPGWTIQDKSIDKEFQFRDFSDPLPIFTVDLRIRDWPS
jgi:hypothetical protein